MSKIEINEVEAILEDSIYPVGYKLSTAVNINNNGILNEQMLEKARRAFVMETVGVWSSELVNTSQGYPKDDISDVTFDIDVVILKRKDFETIKTFYEQFYTEGTTSINNQA
tara:strand:+ start:16671 stop:17006 length:336 start_codon:yes stop_codon:yes gene_type:complete